MSDRRIYHPRMFRSLFCLVFLTRIALSAAPLDPLFKTVDLAIGESVEVAVSDETTVRVRLIKVEEHRGKVWGEVFRVTSRSRSTASAKRFSPDCMNCR
jgi:hypothetical protein